MNFLHPAFLWGATAVTVPLVLHFLLRKRVRNVRFSTLALLRLLDKKRSRRMRLARLLLLLVRMAIVAAAVLLFAQPVFRSGFLGRFHSGPRRVLFLFDNSMSSALRPGGGDSLCSRARTLLEERLGSMDPRTGLVVMALAPSARVVYRGDVARFRPDSLPGPSYGPPDTVSAMARLEQVFSGTPEACRHVVVVSDFQHHPWRKLLGELRKKVPGTVELLPVKVGPFRDWGITGIATDTRVLAKGEDCRFLVRLRWQSRGKEPSPSRLVVSSGGKVLSVHRLVPGKEACGRRSIAATVRVGREGPLVVRFRLDDDDLQLNNESSSVVRVVDRRLALVFDGDPRPEPLNDEAFFLGRFYGGAMAGRYRLRVYEPDDDPSPAEISRAAVIHLAAWAPSDPGSIRAFKRYLEQGGTLVLWAGDSLDRKAANRGLLEPLAGLRICGKGEGVSSWTARPNSDTPLGYLLAQSYLGRIASSSHFFLKTLDRAIDLGGGGKVAEGHVDAARFVALGLEDGSPLLVVRPVGAGWFVFFNTTADQQWSDFPVHPLFPVLMATIPRLSGGGIKLLKQGECFASDVDMEERGDAVAEVRTPGGRKLVISPEFTKRGLSFVFGGTWRPGVYEMTRTIRDERTCELFEVMPNEKENELVFLDETSLSTAGEGRGGGSGTDGSSTLRLTDLLFLLLALLLLVEAVLVSDLERTICGEPDEA